jgi:site-specific DNA-adenine methylase
VTLKAPFPYFGGKSAIAPVVWQRFGDPPNYDEPFVGSAAVLLARPPSVEYGVRPVRRLDNAPGMDDELLRT